MGNDKRHISSYSTHVNGKVEKPNQSLANILASISQNTNDWDEQLPHTMLALNSAINKATYTSPFFLEHGRDIRLPYTYEKNSDTPQNKWILVNGIVIYSHFGLAIHQNDHQARRRFVQWAQNEIAVVPDFHKRILFSDEAHFWLNDYINKQNCRIWSEANPQVYVETPLHPEKLTVCVALWAGGILLQKR
ncbi:integrase catalytic domain-containing protein [Trichonephila clavipes]|nr:integrase catalytic domain-containing protein [Trichonephila clavipes]